VRAPRQRPHRTGTSKRGGFVNRIRRGLRVGYLWLEGWFEGIFGPDWNPLYHTGGLGFFYYWIVAVSGIYLYVFFDTGTTEAYASVEYMTNEQWYAAGVMRSLHRYASDGLVLLMVVHVLREFAFDRYRGARWFTWVTGVPIAFLVIASGITGYWLVWDTLAQYVAIATTEWFDWLPIFGEPIARNFLSPESLDDRFFTLMIFIHIAVPLILLIVLWIHLQRVSRPKMNPPRGLAVGTFLMLVALSLVKPALSQGPADLSTVPAVVGLDWFYLGFYPLLDIWSAGPVWGLVGFVTLTLLVLPWMPPMRRAPVAVVNLDHCNGCSWCVDDCPYNAVSLQPRTDGLPFSHEAVVDANLCVSCGICMGACPSSTPFRRARELVSGIDLPHLSLKELRERTEQAARRVSGPARIVVFGCDLGANVPALAGPEVAAVSLPCIAMLPPSFIDYVLSRDLADGVFVTGCRGGECHNRLGVRWMEERLAGKRDPYLRARVPRERVASFWAAPTERRRLADEVAAFGARIRAMAAGEEAARRKRRRAKAAAQAE
jgi:ferredoxin/coenzyme F420-reducing hydrogenase delta subunit